MTLSPDAKYYLKLSTGDTFTHTPNDRTRTDYNLTLTKGGIAYRATKDISPTLTTVSIAGFVKA